MLSWTHQPEILGILELSLGSQALGGGSDSEADGPCVLSSLPGWPLGDGGEAGCHVGYQVALPETPLVHQALGWPWGVAVWAGQPSVCSLEQVGGPP